MAGYTNGIFHLDYVNGSDTARATLASVIFSNDGGAVKGTRVGHGLITGAIIDITLTTNWNGSWKITRIDDDNFYLDGAVWSAGADNDGQVIPRGGQSWTDAWKTITSGATSARLTGEIVTTTIKIAKSTAPTSLGQTALWTGVSIAGGGMPATKAIVSSTNATPIEMFVTSHDYQNGDVINILGHAINTNANGTWIIQNKTTHTFELVGSVGNGVGVATGTVQLINAKAVKLTSALTKTLHNCETIWTSGTNGTATLETNIRKQGYSSAKCVSNATGIGDLIYIDLGVQVDFSAYKQISFWFQNTTALAGAGNMRIRMYSDAGRTVQVEDLQLPAIASAGSWLPITIDKGSALSAVVRVIALYANVAQVSKTFYIDNLIACKDATSADSLTLTSLISKNSGKQEGDVGGTEGWYGIQSITDRIILLDNGTYCRSNEGRGYSGTTEDVTTYKRETIKTSPLATAGGTVVQEAQQNGSATVNIQYQGGYDTASGLQDSETFFDGLNGMGYGINLTKNYNTFNWISAVRYYGGIRVTGNNITITNIGNINNNGCEGLLATGTPNFTIGTIYNANNNNDSQGNTGAGVEIGAGGSPIVNLLVTRIYNVNNNMGGYYYGGIYIIANGGYIETIDNANNNSNNTSAQGFGICLGGQTVTINIISNINYNSKTGISFYGTDVGLIVNTISNANYNGAQGFRTNNPSFGTNGRDVTIGYISANYNTSYGILFDNAMANIRILSGSTSNNGVAGVYFNMPIYASYPTLGYLMNVAIAEATKISYPAFTDYKNYRFYVHNYNNVTDDHRIYTDNGFIQSELGANRHTLSGIAWRLLPNNVKRNLYYPLNFSVAKVAVNAGSLVTAKIWMKKTHATEVVGKLICRAYQLAGITTDQVVTKANDTSWEELTITFTPTVSGVVDIEVQCYIAGTSVVDSIYVDDMTITQA